MAQRGGVVDHHDAARTGERGQVGRAQERRCAQLPRPDRQHELLPGVAGAVGERRRRAQHDIAAGPQRRQADSELARPALDAAELGPDGGAGVDGDPLSSGRHAGAL
jgi:hypothetical protein